MDVPPGVACLDTRHPRRLLTPEQVLMRFSIYDRPSPNYLKTLVVGYHLRYSRKEEVPICPKTRPHRSRLPLYGEYPMSCGSSSNRSSKSTMRQSARCAKVHRSSVHRPTPSPRCDHLQDA